MLVLSRVAGEMITIDVPPSTRPQRIVVSVTEIRGPKVRLGFTCSREITVMRPEVTGDLGTVTANNIPVVAEQLRTSAGVSGLAGS